MGGSAGGSTPISARAASTRSSSRRRAPSARCTSARISRRRAGIRPSLWLIVSDIEAARDELKGRGIEVSEVFHFAGLNRVAPDSAGERPRSGPGQLRVVRVVQ